MIEQIIGKVCHCKLEGKAFTDENTIECKVIGFDLYIEDGWQGNLIFIVKLIPTDFSTVNNDELQELQDGVSHHSIYFP